MKRNTAMNYIVVTEAQLSIYVFIFIFKKNLKYWS